VAKIYVYGPNVSLVLAIIYFLILIHNTIALWPRLCLWAQYQSSSGHYIGNASTIVDPSGQLTQPSAVFHPRLMPWYNSYILFLMRYTKGLWPRLKSLGLLWAMLWPLHRNCLHSSRPVQSNYGTCCGFSPKPHALIQSLHILTNT
jgi:hypothetical protein